MLLSSLTPASRFERPRPRLVCVDLQREYVVPGRPLFAAGAGEIAETCVRVLAHARAADWRVVHVRRRLSDGLFDVSGHFGAPIEGLRPLIREPVFAHSTLSAFGNRDFDFEMREALGEEVFLMGFSLSGSLLATALGAIDAGLSPTVIADAAGAAPAPGIDHETARDAAMTLLGSLVRMADSRQVLDVGAAVGAPA
ncbi:MAG TPA: isochorismatase family protein [Caulobacteraceae bacterium]|nr:isochorismatase family protein [Caulobacteraceae bacterium]